MRQHLGSFAGGEDLEQKYLVSITIGTGYTYTKYNTLLHFLNVAEGYWHNPDLNGVHLFGKDVRAPCSLVITPWVGPGLGLGFGVGLGLASA